MKLLFPLVFIFVAACSTLSQTVETPVLMEKKKLAAGVGALYSHNLNQNNVANDELDEYKPSFFLGGRYGLGKNVEVAVAGGTFGLTAGSGLDVRLRYQYYNGWRYPDDDEDYEHPEEDEQEEKRKSKRKKRKKKKKKKRNAASEEDDDDDDDEFIDDDTFLADKPAYVPNGWVSTLSFGLFWSGFNNLEDYSVDQYDGGAYISNSLGWKKNNWVYYFGGKIIQLETEYRYKVNRFTQTEDINSKYNELTFGVFGGVTYQWKTRSKHGYIIDVLLSVMQLPQSALDRSNSFYPAITTSFWYID